jgi:glucokinase
MDLIADIGATNTRCALLDAQGRIARSATFQNNAFGQLEEVLRQFLDDAAGAAPERAALAIAAPVSGDDIAMTNIGWHYSQTELRQALRLRQLLALNDFEALAHALPRLKAGDCHPVGGGQALAGATLAVLGPGSGLGVATAAAHGDGWTAVGGEGGHVSIPAMTATEVALIADHGDASGHCSAETLLSGPGLVRIHATVARLAGLKIDIPTPAEITASALQGDETAIHTYDVFFALLGTVAGNLALTVGARGGIYIAGGIVPRVLKAFAGSTFRERFVAKGRYRAYLDAIPTAVITADVPAFIGLKALLGYD